MKMMIKRSLYILFSISLSISSFAVWAGCQFNLTSCDDKENVSSSNQVQPEFENFLYKVTDLNRGTYPQLVEFPHRNAFPSQQDYEDQMNRYCSYIDEDNAKSLEKGETCTDLAIEMHKDLNVFREKGWSLLSSSWRAQFESSILNYVNVSEKTRVDSSCNLYNITKSNNPKILKQSVLNAYKTLEKRQDSNPELKSMLVSCAGLIKNGNISSDRFDEIVSHIFKKPVGELVDSMHTNAKLRLDQASDDNMCVPNRVFTRLNSLPSVEEIELLARKKELFTPEHIQNVFENVRKGGYGVTSSDDELIYKLMSRDPRLRLIFLGPDDGDKYNEKLSNELRVLRDNFISKLQSAMDGRDPKSNVSDLSHLISEYSSFLDDSYPKIDTAFDYKCQEMEISLMKMVCSANDFDDQGVDKNIDSFVFKNEYIQSLPSDMTGGTLDNDGIPMPGHVDQMVGGNPSCTSPAADNNGEVRPGLCLSRGYETLYCNNYVRNNLAGEFSIHHADIPITTLNLRSMAANPLFSNSPENGYEKNIKDKQSDLMSFTPGKAEDYGQFCAEYKKGCSNGQATSWDQKCFMKIHLDKNAVNLTNNPDLVRMFEACKINPDSKACDYIHRMTTQGPTTIEINVDEDIVRSFESLADDRGITDHSFSSVVSELSAGEAKNLKNTSNEDSIVKTENAWDFDFGVESLNDLNINNETDYSKIATTVQSAMSNVDTKLASEQKKLEDTKVEHSKVIEELSDANLDDDRRSELEAQKNMFEQRMKSSEATIAQLISQRDDLTKLIDDLNKKIDNKQSPTIVSDNNSQVVNNGQNTRIVAGTTSSGDNHAQPDHISNNTQSAPQFNVGTSNGSALDGREQSAGGINSASNNFNMGIGYLTRKQMEQYETQLRSKAIPMNVDDLLQVSDPQKLKELLSKFGLDNENEFYIFDEAQKAYIKVDGHSIVDGKIVYKIGGKLAAVETDKHVNREPANAPQVKPVDNPSDRAFFLDKLKEIMKGN